MNILSLIPLLNVKTIASLLNIVQLIIQTIKEILTIIINAALPFIPNAKVQKIRDVFNKIDDWIEKFKVMVFGVAK